MLALEICLIALCLWYVCGVFNIAIMQATDGDSAFHVYSKGTTLFLCYGGGLILTAVMLLFGLFYIPIKLGTRIGRYVGRIAAALFDIEQ